MVHHEVLLKAFSPIVTLSGTSGMTNGILMRVDDNDLAAALAL